MEKRITSGHDHVEPLDPVLGLALRPAVSVQEGGSHPRVGQYFLAAHDPLMNVDGGGPNRFDRAEDEQIVAEPGRFTIFDCHFSDVIGASIGSKGLTLVHSYGSNHVGPRPLHELEIVGVVNDPGGVRVLEIDRQGEPVFGPDEATAIRNVEISTCHRGSLTGPIPAQQIDRLTSV
jgi:hypothetical protein